MPVKLDAFTETVRDLIRKYSSHMLPLTRTEKCDRDDVADIQSMSPSLLFPGGRAPEAAVSGLLLLAGCWDESHEVSQDIPSREGSYWHGIAHRIEPDSSNAGYWFRRVGEHPIFPELRRRASGILEHRRVPWALKAAWDPFLFIEWCEQARQAPGTENERIALEIQRQEWELLFEWCALEPLPQ
jgi:hypothetical protein